MMLRGSCRLIHYFCKRANPAFTYKVEIQKFQTPQYLIGNIFNSKYLHENWKKLVNQSINIAGWVRNVRVSNQVMFINLFDGAASKEIQIVIDKDHPSWEKYIDIKKGYSLKLEGTIKQIPSKKQDSDKYQVFINQKQQIEVLGECDPSKYVLSAKNVKLETVRDYLHLRSKTLRMSTIARIRNTLSFATHSFFQQNGFVNLHTPIITTSDCQGAGEMFHVTTMFKEKDIQKSEQGEIDFNKDFFKRAAGLTVSGQLAAQTFCCGMSKVYTFGPTFRAEVSNTTRHVAEFWMIEPEFAFADLHDAMDLAESYIKSCVVSVVEKNQEDLTFLESKKQSKEGINIDLHNLLKSKISSFKRMTYTEAVQQLSKFNDKFENKVDWGCDLSTQHERYLCQQITKSPTFVYNYPASIKPFYMRVNQDSKTVASFDLLAPGIGQIIGGSQREERLEYLQKRMNEMNIGKDNLQWYLDLRRFGTVPHSGFGVGFDRLVMFCTETQNIRDVIPFPRTPGRADC